MAWSKLEDTFYDDAKFRRLAAVLGLNARNGMERGMVIAQGFVSRLWSWASRHAPDGYLPADSVSPADIERIAGWSSAGGRLLAGLVSTGFVDEITDGQRVAHEIHRFWERAESHKAAIKKRKQREAKGLVPGQSRPPSKTSPGLSRLEERRGEERRGEERGDLAAPAPESGTMVEIQAARIPVGEALKLFEHWQNQMHDKRGVTKAVIPPPATLGHAKLVLALAGGDMELACAVVTAFIGANHGFWAERNHALYLLTDGRDFERARLIAAGSTTAKGPHVTAAF